MRSECNIIRMLKLKITLHAECVIVAIFNAIIATPASLQCKVVFMWFGEVLTAVVVEKTFFMR